MEEPALIHIPSSPEISIHERTHMTLTLTKMGRSPLHYACLSYRGLGVEAFSVLLEATIDAFKQVNQLEALKQRGDNLKYKLQGDDTLTNQTSEQETESVKLSSNDVEPTHEESNHTSHKSSAFTMLDQTGQSPLALLFQRYKERVRYVVKRVDSVLTPPHRGDRRPSQSSAQATAAIQADLGELWEKAKLIVGKMVQEQQDMKSYGDLWRNKCILDTPFPSLVLEPPTVYASSLTSSLFHSDSSIKAEEKDCSIIQKTKKFRILHASVSLTGYGCPSEMICLALSVHPNEIQEMDEDGNLPLHIASIAPSFLGHEPLASSSSKTIKQMDVDPNPFDTVIRLLVRYYPAGAQVPNGVTGHLPLHLALDARQRTWKDGLLALMEAYPPALEGSSLELKLYPYILSMLGRRSESTDRKSIARQMPRNRNRLKNGQVVKEDMGPPLILFDILRSKPTLFGR
jgi:ankyrin repeat protein